MYGWLNLWYMDHMPKYFAEMEQYEVDSHELRDAVEYICEESEALSSLPVGLLADFIRDAWNEVNWHELANHLNCELAALDPELEDEA